MQEIALQESLHPNALCNEIEQVVNALGIRTALLRHHPTDSNAAMNPHVEKRRIKHGSSHIVKVNVYALWKIPV